MTLCRCHRQRMAEAGFQASQTRRSPPKHGTVPGPFPSPHGLPVSETWRPGSLGTRARDLGAPHPPALTTVMLTSTLKSECAFFNLG